MTRRRTLAFGIAVLVIALDQLAKAWLLGHLGAVGTSLLGPIRITLSFNSGVSFGFLRSNAPWTRWLLAVFSLAVSLALARWAWRAEKAVTAAGLGFVIGGALGNMVDRLARGRVVDFIDASALHFPWVFNLADSAITVGVALLLLESVFLDRSDASHGRNGAKGLDKLETRP